MNVNLKGDIGLIETIRKLTHEGFECFLPMNDHSPVDLIAMKDCRLHRLQVKYRTLVRGHIDVPLHSVVNGKKVPINVDAIDGWAVYCPEVDEVVFINKNEVDLTKQIAFRLAEGANTVSKNTVKRKLYTEYGRLAEW